MASSSTAVVTKGNFLPLEMIRDYLSMNQLCSLIKHTNISLPRAVLYFRFTFDLHSECEVLFISENSLHLSELCSLLIPCRIVISLIIIIIVYFRGTQCDCKYYVIK